MDTLLVILVIVGILVGISAAILYYLEKTKSERIKNVRESKGISAENDAYNKVKSAQSISRIFRRKGYDTSEADGLLDEAEREIENGNYAEAKNLARDARSKIEQIKKGSPTMNKNENEGEKKKKGYSIDELDNISVEKDQLSEREEEMKEQQERIKSLPDNYLESKFELNIIKEKINQVRENEDAEKYYNLAKKYFDEGSYTESLRYSVKCKKSIEGEGSGFLSGQNIDKEKKDTSELKKKVEEKIPELKEMEEEKEPEDTSKAGIEVSITCPSCGHKADSEDRYCAKCGTELEEIYRCGSCGKEVSEDDNFCPKCGNELGITVFECPECGEEVSPDTRFCPSCGVEFE